MEWMIRCFPAPLRQELLSLRLEMISDIRLFADRPCLIRGDGGECVLSYIPAADDLFEIAQALCGRMLRLSPAATGEGYIALQGGHRMGLCGRVEQTGEGLLLRGLGSLCIRVAHQVPGCGRKLAELLEQGGGLLIVGEPGSGKTTLLRDTVRLLSEAGRIVGLADERSEVAACLDGVPQLDVGMRTHVVDGCRKADGLRWLLRAMSPQLLATDELFGEADCQAVREAAACGVPVLATAHAGSAKELCARSGIRTLLMEGLVKRVVFLHRHKLIMTLMAKETLEAACWERS